MKVERGEGLGRGWARVDEVEVVGHEAEGEDADGGAVVGLLEGAEEGVVVGGFAEDGLGGWRVVEDVVDVIAEDDAWFAGHGVEFILGWERESNK